MIEIEEEEGGEVEVIVEVIIVVFLPEIEEEKMSMIEIEEEGGEVEVIVIVLIAFLPVRVEVIVLENMSIEILIIIIGIIDIIRKQKNIKQNNY